MAVDPTRNARATREYDEDEYEAPAAPAKAAKNNKNKLMPSPYHPTSDAGWWGSVFTAAKSGVSLGLAQTASDAAALFVLNRLTSVFPVLAVTLVTYPQAKAALLHAVPPMLGWVAHNRMLPGLSDARQEKLASWCLMATAGKMNLLMSALGEDFFLVLFRKVDRAVEDAMDGRVGE